jgi:threonine dehydratase
MAAAVNHCRSGEDRAVIVGVEPIDADYVQVSALDGDTTHVAWPQRSIMVSLNCGRPSLTAWPRLTSGIDWLVADDAAAAKVAMRDLSDAAVAAGETGAACLAGFDALLADENARAALLDLSTATILVVAEGATGPANFEAIVRRSPESVGRVLTAID